jgi:hypothetical protein
VRKGLLHAPYNACPTRGRKGHLQHKMLRCLGKRGIAYALPTCQTFPQCSRLDSPVSSTIALQAAFPGFCAVTEAVEKLARTTGIEERGAIFAKREVVEFILDIIGYTKEQPLNELSQARA